MKKNSMPIRQRDQNICTVDRFNYQVQPIQGRRNSGEGEQGGGHEPPPPLFNTFFNISIFKILDPSHSVSGPIPPYRTHTDGTARLRSYTYGRTSRNYTQQTT